MISSYFEGCPVLNASGRTFPVQHLFLEDIYEISGYVLDPDSVGALRDSTSWKDRQKQLVNSSGSKNKGVIQSQWGDAAADTVLNPYYDDDLYHNYRYVCVYSHTTLLDIMIP
jgi:ATP-dependent RNA helicase DHX29